MCQATANDRLGLPCQLWLFLCPTRDTLLLSVPCGWYNPPSASHPTPPPPPTHPLYTLSVILQQLEKNYLKSQQFQLGGRISYKTIAT